ncbi:MAG: hypothetical protein LEGION0398_MBIBDBAK_01188 [Legionellaceae bacterium]
MFDLSLLKLEPCTSDDVFISPATDAQIEKLEHYCGHSLPGALKEIFKYYNGCSSSVRNFIPENNSNSINEICTVSYFFALDNRQDKMPPNIWWAIQEFSEFLGGNSLPIAEDDEGAIYFLKWVGNIPQVWLLKYTEREKPKSFFIMNSFENMLGALYEE